MNDRYLFRAKRIDNGEWVEGYLVETRHNTYHDGYRIIDKDGINYDELDYYEPSFISYVIDKTTICQCTGLKDKNGKLIWENDIVEAWSQGRCAIGKIKHRIDGTWIMYPAWQSGEMWYLLPNDDGITTVEVIGNIFDNPELMNE